MENKNHLCRDLSLNCQKIKADEFKKLIKDYFESDKASRFGLPAAGYFADKLQMQTEDLENLIKKEIGATVKDCIDNGIVNAAKLKFFDTRKPINYTASELGFRNHNHFTILFKKKAGTTPSKYRDMLIKHFTGK